MNKFIFFDDDSCAHQVFECVARGYEEAFHFAFESMGPQVQEWYCKIVR
jgi:hypothetical protein